MDNIVLNKSMAFWLVKTERPWECKSSITLNLFIRSLLKHKAGQPRLMYWTRRLKSKTMLVHQLENLTYSSAKCISDDNHMNT